MGGNQGDPKGFPPLLEPGEGLEGPADLSQPELPPGGQMPSVGGSPQGPQPSPWKRGPGS